MLSPHGCIPGTHESPTAGSSSLASENPWTLYGALQLTRLISDFGNLPQVKEKKKGPEEKLNEVEASSRPDTGSKTMVIGVLEELREEWTTLVRTPTQRWEAWKRTGSNKTTSRK